MWSLAGLMVSGRFSWWLQQRSVLARSLLMIGLMKLFQFKGHSPIGFQLEGGDRRLLIDGILGAK